MIDLLSSVRFVPSYPQLNVPVSQTKFGGRVLSTVEYADRYRTVDMETLPMKASEAVKLQSFIAAAQGGMETIVYRPKHICIPQAYWGQPSGPNTNPGDVAAQGDFVAGAYKVRGDDVPQSTAMSFVRNSVATYFDSTGTMRTAAVNEPRFDHDPGEMNLTWPSEDLTGSQWAKTRMSASLANIWNGYQFTRLTPNTDLQTSHQATNNRTFASAPFDRRASFRLIVKGEGSQAKRCQMRVFDTVGLFGYVGVNIVDGTVSIPTADIQSSVQNLGDGYFQVFVTQTVRAGATTAGIQFYASNPDAFNASNFDWNGTDGYLVSACQFELSPTQSPYKKTTTGPMAKPLGLIVEPTRTNYVLASESLTNSRWNATRMAAASAGMSDGLNWTRLTPSADLQVSHQITQTSALIYDALAVDTPVTLKLLAKPDGAATTRLSLRCFDSIGFSHYVYFDMATGSAFNAGASMQRSANGAWLLTVTFMLRAGSTSSGYQLYSANPTTNNVSNYDFNGTDGYLVSACQMEWGDKPSSYISTGTAVVTRQGEGATLYATGTNNWTIHSETGATQSLGNIGGGAQLTSANLNSKYVRDYKAVTVTAPPSPIEATATRGTVTNGYTVQLLNVTPGLELRDGDLISFKSGDYRQMVQIAYGGGAKAVSTQMTIKVDQPIASYIASGATVRFRQPEMNTRLVKDSFQMSKGPRPTATFQLIEVPK